MQSTFHNSGTQYMVGSEKTIDTTPQQNFIKAGKFVIKQPEVSMNEKQNFLMDLKLDDDPGDVLLDDPLMIGMMRIKGVKNHNEQVQTLT